MATYGWFGGTFDPPHTGHLLAATYAVAVGDLARLFVEPSRHHPFGKQPTASWQDRLHMCALAMQPLRQAEVVPGPPAPQPADAPSYAISSLEHLMHEHPGHTWRLVIGSDLLADLPRWHQHERLLALAPPLVVPRAGSSEASIAIPNINATQLRQALARNAVPEGWLPEHLHRLLQQQGLYVDDTGNDG